MIRTFCIAVLLLVCAPAALPAQSMTMACRGEGSQREVDECAGREMERADSALDQTHSRVVQMLEKQPAQFFRAAHRSWKEYRDAECTAQAELVRGGTIYPATYGFCVARLTREREAELRRAFGVDSLEALARHAVGDAADRLLAAAGENDTAALRALMHPRAQVVVITDGGVTARTADEWIRGLSADPHAPRKWSWDPRIHAAGGLGTLSSPWSVHAGARASHCGDVFLQFVHDAPGRWRVIAATYTWRAGGCE